MSVVAALSPRRSRCRPPLVRSAGRTRRVHDERAFTPLIDAKTASGLLGVPYTWLLAQARAGHIPHNRLGHYVRFNPEDLRKWLGDTRIGPGRLDHRAGH